VNKFFTILATLAAMNAASFAQSVTPMRGQARSFADSFAIRIIVGNPYKNKQVFSVRVYDDKFYPVEAQVTFSEVTIPAEGSKSVVVMVPFDGMTVRKVRVCAEGMFGKANEQRLRTQVCGKYLGTRVGS
jgi:hypothetical protein